MIEYLSNSHGNYEFINEIRVFQNNEIISNDTDLMKTLKEHKKTQLNFQVSINRSKTSFGLESREKGRS